MEKEMGQGVGQKEKKNMTREGQNNFGLSSKNAK